MFAIVQGLYMLRGDEVKQSRRRAEMDMQLQPPPRQVREVPGQETRVWRQR